MIHLETTHPVARKEHRCEACYRLIEKGERHYVSACQEDGHAYSWRYHEFCNDWMDAIPDLFDPYEGYWPGCVIEDIHEMSRPCGIPKGWAPPRLDWIGLY